jgi:hypothetical protein
MSQYSNPERGRARDPVFRYYSKLFKEYCIADLSRYKERKIGMRWRVEKEVVVGKGQGLMDIARHGITCHLAQEMKVQNAFDDVASTIHLSLATGSSAVATSTVTRRRRWGATRFTLVIRKLGRRRTRWSSCGGDWGIDGQCSPRHQPHCEPSLPELWHSMTQRSLSISL